MVKRRCSQGDFLYCSTTGCKNIGSYLNRVEEHILQALSNMLSDYEYYVDNYEQETIKEKRNVDNDLKRIEKEIEKQQAEYEQVIYSVAMEPALKEAIKIAGKKKGKLQGGAKAVIREALIEHFKKNKDYFN